eukprot:CAMPEP_0168381544 /NCGR_PEP_ID=MMETSP0228-20121227/12933_1 /TAXON_ID=133427 /ORGANISM="Protoceratium reticulatum, Strain CCCM 535 (=CCMP 1889)" /LENGTH=166 /DNA_ID=CAMNT_0008394649 /DNA_START=317 /DNA_END=813 /DNA_ORIENTATION=-
MVLQFLRCVLLAKRRDLVEIHLKVVRHLLCEVVLGGGARRGAAGELQELHAPPGALAGAAGSLLSVRIKPRSLDQLAEEKRCRTFFARALLTGRRMRAALLQLLPEDLRGRHALPQALHVDATRPVGLESAGRHEKRGGKTGGGHPHWGRGARRHRGSKQGETLLR